MSSYFDSGGRDLSSFLRWLERTKEPLLDLTTGSFTHFDDVLSVRGGKIRMTREPEELVFVSAKTTSAAVAPWLAV